MDNTMNNLQSLYDDNNKNPTTLFELSTPQYKQLLINSLHLTGLSMTVGSNKNGQQISYFNINRGQPSNHAVNGLTLAERNGIHSLIYTKYNQTIVL